MYIEKLSKVGKTTLQVTVLIFPVTPTPVKIEEVRSHPPLPPLPAPLSIFHRRDHFNTLTCKRAGVRPQNFISEQKFCHTEAKKICPPPKKKKKKERRK